MSQFYEKRRDLVRNSFVFVKTKLSRPYLERDLKLTVSVPQLDILFRKLIKYLNRASNPHVHSPRVYSLPQSYGLAEEEGFGQE